MKCNFFFNKFFHVYAAFIFYFVKMGEKFTYSDETIFFSEFIYIKMYITMLKNCIPSRKAISMRFDFSILNYNMTYLKISSAVLLISGWVEENRGEPNPKDSQHGTTTPQRIKIEDRISLTSFLHWSLENVLVS